MVKNRHGWTLVEMMVVAAVIGIFAMITPRLITVTTQNLILGRTKIELQREARSAMYVITRELRQAQSNTIIIDQVVGQPYYSRIRFTKASGTNVTITQTNNAITLKEGSLTSTITQNLEFMAFSFPESDDMTIASVSLTLQKQIYGGQFKALHMASEQVRVMN